MKSTAAILATAMFVWDRTTASPLLAGMAAVVDTNYWSVGPVLIYANRLALSRSIVDQMWPRTNTKICSNSIEFCLMIWCGQLGVNTYDLC